MSIHNNGKRFSGGPPPDWDVVLWAAHLAALAAMTALFAVWAGARPPDMPEGATDLPVPETTGQTKGGTQ